MTDEVFWVVELPNRTWACVGLQTLCSVPATLLAIVGLVAVGVGCGDTFGHHLWQDKTVSADVASTARWQVGVDQDKWQLEQLVHVQHPKHACGRQPAPRCDKGIG